MSNALFCQAPAHTPSTLISPNKIRAKIHFYPLLGTLKNIFSPPRRRHATAPLQPLARFFWGNGEWLWAMVYHTQSPRSSQSFLNIFDESLKYRQFHRIGRVSPHSRRGEVIASRATRKNNGKKLSTTLPPRARVV
jgi:hypothetical protein